VIAIQETSRYKQHSVFFWTMGILIGKKSGSKQHKTSHFWCCNRWFSSQKKNIRFEGFPVAMFDYWWYIPLTSHSYPINIS
jgi:hypothetical protein